MAPTSSSSTPRPNHTDAIGYDVFISFRGADTGYTFTDHLHKALILAGLRIFRDGDEIRLGQQLKPEVKDAIMKSRASIVVLSENYANSRWCLDELWLILEQRRRNCNHLVLPVFYRVQPSVVMKRGRIIATQGSKWTGRGNTRRWTAALTEVADLTTGMILNSGSKTYETDFIKQVVQAVISQLDLNPAFSTPLHLTGMETRLEDINSCLKNEDYNAIAICGMGGSGKTTIAQCVYNSNKHDFESSSFIAKLGENYRDSLLRVQEQLLRDVKGKKNKRNIKISNILEGTSMVEEVLQTKRVLIVLDDIEDQEVLSTLLGTKALHTQSKVIITTSHQDIDAWFVSKPSRCVVYKLKSLDFHESIELLSWHAFGSKVPMEGFGDLAVQLAQYCGGNPLALKVLGSSVVVSFEDSLKRNSMIKVWRERVNLLNSSKGDLDYKIKEVLRTSFDSLQHDSHKELFLDIACFFVGERKDMVTIWGDDLHAKYGVMTLINRCLVTVSPDSSSLMMHQLLQDMGRNIVREESKDPSKHSRVWLDDESYHVLRKENGSDTIEGLALDLQKLGQGRRSEPLALKTGSLARMKRLKFLRLKDVTLTGSYENIPDLRWLCWHGFHVKTMPPGLLKSSLVAIDMSGGHMETFEAPTVLNSLKVLDLKECDKLVSIYSLYRLPKLKELSLSYCSSLVHLCESIGDLESLSLLDLKGCTKLFKASSNKKNVKSGTSKQPLFSFPCSLKFLYLNNCDTDYNSDVQVAFHAQSFFNLFLECNVFQFLPNSIDLNVLRVLNLYSCSLLKSLPYIPSTLEELYIDWCCSLEKITFQSGRFTLQHFSYEGCSQLSEVQGFFKIVPLAEIDEADLVQHMRWIKEHKDSEVDLVSGDITKHKFCSIQMLYEYGIMSTYLQGVTDQSLPTYEYTSSSSFLSFRMPLHHEKNRIRGLIVSCLYRSSPVPKDKDGCLLLAKKIRNRTKGLTWIYNPMVYCKPRVDEDVVWLSYWPIGNILDAGDEVDVCIIVDDGVIVSMCGTSLVYMDDGEEENCENNMIEEEVIGGDLSEFEVTRGGYYLCRRDLFGLETSTGLKVLFDGNVDYPESQGWAKTHQARMRNYRTGMVVSGYDVFLSFQGEDTRHNFTDHLYKALLRAGLHTFRGNDDIDRGQEIAAEIRTAINKSRGSIVVLSKNYGKSRWCLEELCLILEQNRKCVHFVLPVFYHVDPSYVRKQVESVAIQGWSNGTVDDMERWKEALKEVAKLAGMVVSGSEAEFIASVIDTIKRKLGSQRFVSDHSYLGIGPD